MISDSLPILYVKTGCPWCIDAVNFFQQHGIAYREANVTENASARDEMLRKSGQSKAPTLDWHGAILADFGVDELGPFLREKSVNV